MTRIHGHCERLMDSIGPHMTVHHWMWVRDGKHCGCPCHSVMDDQRRSTRRNPPTGRAMNDLTPFSERKK